MRKIEFVQSAYVDGFPDKSKTFKHGEPLWLISKLELNKVIDLLTLWHASAKGHHPEESCCDVTEAIFMLEAKYTLSEG